VVKMADSDLIKLLEQLSLTEYEAKTIVALHKLSESEAPEISRTAQVPKTRVYDVLDRLTKKNLVIEIHGRPKRYRSMDADSVLGELLQGKRAELKELEQQADSIKRSLTQTKSLRKGFGENVMKVKEKTDFMRILSQEIDEAKNNITAFTNVGKEHTLLKDSIKNAVGRKIDIKMMGKANAEAAKLNKEYAKEPVELRGYDHRLHAYIIDDKKVILGLTDFEQERPEYHFTIWEDNSTMASALQTYFNTCWGKAEKL